MCELLAIASRKPMTVSISLGQFAGHGSDTGGNSDGWGIVYYSEDDIRRLRDIDSAASSEWVRFAEKHPLCSTLFLAHIRNAKVGKVSLSNTHPFARELGGKMHTFAHNGYLQDLTDMNALTPRRFQPIGETDSESAFCALLDRLCEVWTFDQNVPDLAERFGIIAAFAADIRQRGIANFVYCDGDAIFVHSHRRRQRDGVIREPGLWLSHQTVSDDEDGVRGAGVTIASERQQIVVAASVPLTDDGWSPIQSGSLVALRDGQVIDATTLASD